MLENVLTLEEFVRTVERDRPATLSAGEVARVRPNPWVLRAGNGKDARIRMQLGDVRYERAQGESTWHLVHATSDFEILDDAA
jgi:hypothetical protein